MFGGFLASSSWRWRAWTGSARGSRLPRLLGEPPHEALVDDVYARSRGNAYLTSLLVRGLAPNATALPADLPSELSDALAHSWHGMSSGARELTRALAVSGRPETAESLSLVAQQAGIEGDVTALLQEAAQAGVLLARPAATFWFAHPLMTEVLEAGLPPDRRRLLHACWAQLLTDGHDVSSDELDPAHVIGIADHHFRSGDTAAAYEWALNGAGAAERSGGHSEAMRLLRRALDLLRDQGDTEAERALLDRILRAGHRTGDQRGELAAVDELLARIDPDREPIVVSELLVRRSQLRQLTGQHFDDDTDAREAVRLSARHPNSAAHAIALTELERCYFWQHDERGEAIARQAMESALASGDRRALSFALTANVRQQSGSTQPDARVLADAREAQAAALDAGDDETYLTATVWLANLTGVPWADNVIEIHRTGLQTLIEAGAPHAYVSMASVRLADGLFARGDWTEAEELLRVALGSAPAPMADASARLLAATLACRQGRQREAEAHLLRAEEIFAERSGFLGMSFAAVETEVALAHGDYAGAIAGAMEALDRDGTVPDRVESLVPRVARALADQAQAARDRDLDPVEHTAALRALRERFPSTVEDFIPGPTYATAVQAYNAIYDAEALRGLADSGAAATWRRAAELCAAAQMPWDEAYAAWRAAEAGLRAQEDREHAVEALRRAHRLALNLQMVPLLEDISALARSGRIRLSEHVAGESSAEQEIPGLSRREREVLAEVVAGKTYGEIARALFISEKTVSVHVSNMLRKTGTGNRVELAQLATRLGGRG